MTPRPSVPPSDSPGITNPLAGAGAAAAIGIGRRAVVGATGRAWILGLGPLVLAFGMYRINLTVLYPTVREQPNRIFSADTTDYLDLLRHDRVTFETRDTWKHLLYTPVMNPAVRLVRWLFGVSHRIAILNVLAGFAAANVVVAFLALRALGGDGRAALFGAVHGLLFANLVLFSIPETYVLADVVIALYAWALLRFAPRPTVARVALLSSLAGLAALYNVPLLSLMVPTLHVAWRRRGPSAATATAALAPAAVVFWGAFRAVHGPRVFRSLLWYGRWMGAMSPSCSTPPSRRRGSSPIG